MIQTVKRVIVEFWIPFIISSSWTIYTIHNSTEGATITKSITIFGPTFFLVSWLSGQIVRIRRQTKVEDTLTDIVKRSEETISSIESATNRMISSIIGGDSFCYIVFASLSSVTNSCTILLVHSGEFPLYDLHARIVDLDAMVSNSESKSLEEITKHDINFSSPAALPHHAITIRQFNLGPETERKFNIFFSARNGSFVQMVRMVKLNNEWLQATKVIRDSDDESQKIIYKNIPDNFPSSSNNDW